MLNDMDFYYLPKNLKNKYWIKTRCFQKGSP